MNRPDRENVETLLKFIKGIGHGWADVKFIIVDGLVVSWQEIDSKRGHKSPLKKGVDYDA